jgi:hypothetical protein
MNPARTDDAWSSPLVSPAAAPFGRGARERVRAGWTVGSKRHRIVSGADPDDGLGPGPGRAPTIRGTVSLSDVRAVPLCPVLAAAGGLLARARLQACSLAVYVVIGGNNGA